jgi:hypothetical protein
MGGEDREPISSPVIAASNWRNQNRHEFGNNELAGRGRERGEMDGWKRKEEEGNKNNGTHHELVVRYAEEISLRWILRRRSMSRACGWTKLRPARKKSLPLSLSIYI